MHAGSPRWVHRVSFRTTSAVAGILVLGLAACSSRGTESNSPSASRGSDGRVVSGGKAYTIAMITLESPGDTFWDRIRAGAEVSAKQHGIALKYSNDPDPTRQATLIQNAVDSKVDAIATTLATPDALKPAVQAALAAKIPVVAFNAGIDQWKDVGAMMYFGSDEMLAGTTLGAKISAAGGKHVLCVIQLAGSVALEARCAGVKKSLPNTENIQVNGTDNAAVQSTLQAKLQQDKSIDWVVTLGAPMAMLALDSMQAANSTAKLATFDLSVDVAKAIQSGKIQVSVDQQPYVQGYEAVDSLWLYLTNGNVIGGGLPVLTGPSFVDKTNIAQILPYVQNNTR